MDQTGHFEEANWTTTAQLATQTESPLRMEPTVSKETFDNISSAMGVFSLVFEIVSASFPIISAVIYSLPDMRCSTTKYLVALNSADFVAALLLSVYRLWRNADSGAPLSASYHYFSIFGALFVTVACRRMVYCFNLLLTVERFFVITFPLKARYTKIVQSPKLVIGLLVLVVLAYHVYFPLKFTVKASARSGGYTLGYTAMFVNNPDVFVKLATYDKVLFAYLPLALCLGFSVALVISLRRHGVSRKSLREEQSEAKAERVDTAERQLAVTIWVSSLLFVLLSLPSNTVEVVAIYHPHFRHLGFEHYLYHTVHLFAALSLVATRFTNFLAYLSLSTAFRKNFLRLLTCKKVVRNAALGLEHEQRTSSTTKTKMSMSTGH